MNRIDIVLRCMKHDETYTCGDIAEAINLPSGTVTTLLQRLLQEGRVEIAVERSSRGRRRYRKVMQ